MIISHPIVEFWTLAGSSGSLGFIVCVKCCRMVDSVTRWQLSLSWPIHSDHLLITDQMIPPLGREHSHVKTQYSWKAGPGEVMIVENLFHFLHYGGPVFAQT